MQSRIRNLANFMKSKKKQDKKYVLMLGAGVSYGSGVLPTAKMIEEIVRHYAQGYQGTIEERFDQLWREASVDERSIMLDEFFRDKTPSIGYQKLAELVKEEYFDIIFTFNFDNLLEESLHKLGFSDFRVIINGDVKENRILDLLSTPEPRVKILKLHGDLKSNIFTFSTDETLEYHANVKRVVADHSWMDIIICGYAFDDISVIKAFSDRGGSVYYVNPSGAGPSIRGFLLSRKSKNKVIKDEVGKFDNFFPMLYDELKELEEAERIAETKPEAERRREEELVTLYEQGKSVTNPREWKRAIDLLNHLQKRSRGYRDVNELLIQAKSEFERQIGQEELTKEAKQRPISIELPVGALINPTLKEILRRCCKAFGTVGLVIISLYLRYLGTNHNISRPKLPPIPWLRQNIVHILGGWPQFLAFMCVALSFVVLAGWTLDTQKGILPEAPPTPTLMTPTATPTTLQDIETCGTI